MQGLEENRALAWYLTDKQKQKVIEETRSTIAKLEAKLYDNTTKKTAQERRDLRRAIRELKFLNCDTPTTVKARKAMEKKAEKAKKEQKDEA